MKSDYNGLMEQCGMNQSVDENFNMNDIVSSLLLRYGSSFAACVAGSFRTGLQLTLVAKTALRAFAHTFSQSILTL
jgi:hypothetical protein